VAAERPRLNVRPQHCTQSMQGDVLKNVMALVIYVIPSCSVATTARQWPLSAFFGIIVSSFSAQTLLCVRF
jgi:hypothetical protein